MNCSCTLYYFPLSTSASISIPHVVFPVVYRALVSIKWASLLLQKDSLKCQRDRGRRLILSPYLSWRGDNNNKNNRLDLNGSKGNINIFASYGILCFFDSWRAAQPPQGGLSALYICVLCLRLHCRLENDTRLWINEKSINSLSRHIPLLLRVRCFCYCIYRRRIYSRSLRCCKGAFSIRDSVSESPL